MLVSICFFFGGGSLCKLLFPLFTVMFNESKVKRFRWNCDLAKHLIHNKRRRLCFFSEYMRFKKWERKSHWSLLQTLCKRRTNIVKCGAGCYTVALLQSFFLHFLPKQRTDLTSSNDQRVVPGLQSGVTGSGPSQCPQNRHSPPSAISPHPCSHFRSLRQDSTSVPPLPP